MDTNHEQVIIKPAIKDCNTHTTAIYIDLDDMTTLDELNEEQLAKLSFHIGKLVSSKLKEDSLKLTYEKTLQSLTEVDPLQYLQNRNIILGNFLLGIKDSNIRELSLNNRFIMCKTVESVMNLAAPHLLLPLHFRESVVLYSLTGSKIALALMAVCDVSRGSQ